MFVLGPLVEVRHPALPVAFSLLNLDLIVDASMEYSDPTLFVHSPTFNKTTDLLPMVFVAQKLFWRCHE